MDRMTNGQRRAFIEKRVVELLQVYKDNAQNFSSMTEDEQKAFVLGRIEDDLSMSESINQEYATDVTVRKLAWRLISVLDGIALVAWAALAVRELQDIVAFCLVAAVIVTSRITYYYSLRRSQKIQELLLWNANRTQNTDALNLFVTEGTFKGKAKQ
jgi:hypothetical protein